MTGPIITVHHIGREGQPVVVIDGVARDPGALRAAAAVARFGPAAHHYPGIRAPLPAGYLPEIMPVLTRVLHDTFGLVDAEVIDANFSIVTTPPADLSVRQRLPHCDAFAAGRIALVHYLGDVPAGGGTAFHRYRSTGLETIDKARAPVFFEQLDAELRQCGLPHARYVDGDTGLFERIRLVGPRPDRVVL